MLIGFNLTFFPMHVLGIRGMPRRIALYTADRGWGTLNLVSTIGSYLIAIAIIVFFVNVVASRVRQRQEAGDDPWEANTLEWATTSPPPPHNFDSLPRIRSGPARVRRAHGADGSAEEGST